MKLPSNKVVSDDVEREAQLAYHKAVDDPTEGYIDNPRDWKRGFKAARAAEQREPLQPTTAELVETVRRFISESQPTGQEYAAMQAALTELARRAGGA